MTWRLARALTSCTLLFVALALFTTTSRPAAADECVMFPETGHQVCGRFLDYWQTYGGLAQQGLPLTDVFLEVNPTNGQTYPTQYFERARFEYHQENQPPYDVLLGLLGAEQYRVKYPTTPPPPYPGDPFAAPSLPHDCVTLGEGGFPVCSVFLTYWQQHGGLAQQGLPISGVIAETTPTAGQVYPTQYFERARFEYHAENAPPYDVLLGLLGREQFLAKYPSGVPSPAPTREQATVTEVIDGDTIHVQLSSGAIDTVRYIGMDTPETVKPGTPVQCYGPEASARNKQLVEGQAVELEKDVSERDRYGRLLRYVYVHGVMVGETLVREGFARAVAYPPDTKHQAALAAAQQAAQQEGRGLWSACQAAPPPTPSPVSAPTATPVPPAANCDPAYPTVCIPPPPPDLDCGDIPYRNFTVLPPDPHHFDSDHDGIGCES